MVSKSMALIYIYEVTIKTCQKIPLGHLFSFPVSDAGRQ